MGWDADDRDKALSQYIRRRQACGSCGTRPEEWDETRGGDRNAYIADLHQCRGCEVTQAAEAAMTGDEGRGVRVVLKRREMTRGRDEVP